jgi:hypothetical protein
MAWKRGTLDNTADWHDYNRLAGFILNLNLQV